MLTNPTLRSQIDALWNRFWSGGINNPLTAIEQMSYLIFLKRLDDGEAAAERRAKRTGGPAHTSVYERYVQRLKAEAEQRISASGGDAGKLREEDYLPPELRGDARGERLRWSQWTQLPGEQMLAFLRDRVFHFLRNLGAETSSFTQYMQDAVCIIPKASLLQEATKIIEELHISEQNADVQGDMYEYLLNQLASSGKNGQFRTPRHIIRMMAQMANPQLGERICDPAAGSAGFLVAAYEHILQQNTSPAILTQDEEGGYHNLIGDQITDPALHKFLKSKALAGYDNDITMVRIGAMNLMLHGIDEPQFRYADALSKGFAEKNQYRLVLANPPFKGSIDESDVSARFRTKTRKTELLFMELIYDLLELGGRAAVIVPDGVLFGNSNAHQQIRQLLLDKCQLQGVVSMPSGVFKPYAGVSTAVLFFTKSGSPTTGQVWFYGMGADGFSLDDKRQRTAANDIPDLLAEWAQWQKTPGSYEAKSSNVVMVDAEAIRANKYDLSLSRYKPVAYEAVAYDSPEEILDRLMAVEVEIGVLMKGLREHF